MKPILAKHYNFKPTLQPVTCIKLIITPQGTEFYNRKFLGLLRTYNIKYYSIYSDKKCAIVERYILYYYKLALR